jgi:hypothetical protein
MSLSQRDRPPEVTISIMIETLYKTDCPEKGKSECYVLVVTPRPASRERCYSFMEEHGRWDETMRRFIYEVNQIVTEEELTYENALAMYNVAKIDLLNKGFVHSSVQGCLRKEPNGYGLLHFECATA